jgi:hypothetical protein
MAKQCFKCKRTLPVSEFYMHNAMAGGTLNKCKQCTRADVRRNRLANIEYYRQYDRERFHTERRQKTLATRQVRYRAANPAKTAARAAVNRSLRSGLLVRKPCEVCDCEQVDAHHDDYSKPLAVRWLCRKHHLELHGGRL